MSVPQRSKGKRLPLRERLAALEPKYGFCPDCSQPIHNRGAHAEACSGPPRVCQARRPSGFNAWTYCTLPVGHEGPCRYFAD